MITKQYFPSLNGNAFVKENLITKLKEFEGKTNKESFVVGAYNGTPIFADKVDVETIEFKEIS